ncbi:MAG: UDP-N-acetylmuramate dehydrogenase [Candidatus Nanopelagicales bacterium]|nr:UDP-N-acetylmuramate dehydrogenase [Candidatus Nanopelagicales bacterium]MDZ4248699.1 UDP-N-acetylmuramate dehydrogenase [Candidatus Nanopelagicales bacterium]
MTSRPEVRLSSLTTLRVGGPTKTLVRAHTEEELISAVARADADSEPLLILGGGSDVVVADDGWPGTTVLVRTTGIEVAAQGECSDVMVAAGEDWDRVVSEMVDAELAGIEALAGIPGSAGATPIQNVGAYGQEVARVVQLVRVWDRVAMRRLDLEPGECAFGYRDSVFKRDPNRYVVLSVRLRLAKSGVCRPIAYGELARALGVSPGDSAPLSATREAVLGLRRGKGMVLDPDDHDTWSVGSFFVNPVVSAARAADLRRDAPRFPAPDGVKLSAAWLIEQAGFTRGYGDGPAALSGKHSLAITNRGNATTNDVLALARQIREGVRRKFGIVLMAEPTLVGCEL